MSKPIKIVYYSETIDNMGRTESSAKEYIIIDALANSKYWNDDMIFEDNNGQKYFIDDLIDKEVDVYGLIFKVQEE